MENHAYAFIGYTGQEIERFEIPWDSEMPEKDRVRMEGPAVDTDRIRYMKETRGIGPGDVKDLGRTSENHDRACDNTGGFHACGW